MKVLVCGMPRSMTTWAFNVLRELVSPAEGRFIWIAPGSPEEREFVQADGPVLAKCHHFSRALADAADLVVYSYRDLRSAAVSYHRKFASPCTREQLDNWVEAERAWLPLADVVLRYEDIERDPARGVQRLREALARGKPGLRIDAASDAEIAARVEGTFRKIESSTDVGYDASTMILPAHRTFQPEAPSLPPAEKELYDRVGRDFGQWLLSHGYVNGGDYGQEAEYRLAQTLLRTFDAPSVVDVGVERGSFTALAVEAGSARVVGFEPLPRHLEFLARRFPAGGAVEIHALAISDRGGKAQLHVATDPEGNELDYHHTLSDLGDSATVIRSRRALEVRIATLAELARDGTIPRAIDFLKVDTDGHDLSVLHGLGDLRPRVVMAEYWDTLPESSGSNPYTLRDLADWAGARGYRRMVVVRRHGRLELVQLEAPWTVPGDWGNVFFLADEGDFERVRGSIEAMARERYEELCAYIATLMRETEAKEAEIRRLDAAVQELRARLATDATAQLEQKEAVIQDAAAQLGEKEAMIRDLAAELKQREAALQAPEAMRGELEAKEAVIRSLDAAGEQARRELQLVRESMREKDAALQSVNAAVEQLARGLEEKEAVIRTLRFAVDNFQEQQQALRQALEDRGRALKDLGAAAESPEMHLLMVKGLEEKEAVIRELSRALDAYRQAYSWRGMFTRPFNRLAGWAAGRVSFRPATLFTPRLGNLNQHAPRDLRLPSRYSIAPPLAEAPRISLVTPSFRQAAFIERTIRSVLDQHYPNLEYHVQDGGSEDGTREILERYAGSLASWESRPDSGQSQAINLGFARVTGEIMAWLNSDDLLLPGSLAYVADYFVRHPDVDVVYGHRILIDENDKQIGRWVLPGHDYDVLSWADYVPQETLFWRRRIWDTVGGKVDESFRFAMDWDLLVRFRDAGAKFACLPRYIGGFRIHPHQKTSAAISDIGFQEMNRIRQRALGRVPSGIEVRKAVFPYLLKHVFTDLGWRVREIVGAI